MSISTIADRLRSKAKEYEEQGGWQVSRGLRGAIVGYLNKYIGADDLRRTFLGRVFSENARTPMSSKDLSNAQMMALWNWIDATQDEGDWVASQSFVAECREISQLFTSGAWRPALKDGVSILETHCGTHGKTAHLFTHSKGLICLECNPDWDYRKLLEDTEER